MKRILRWWLTGGVYLAGCATHKAPQHCAGIASLKPEKAEYYRQFHANPWPSVNRMIKDCHIRNYSTCERKIDGKLHLFSCLEYTGKGLDAVQEFGAYPIG